MKKVFIVCGGGDRTIGIPNIEAEITVEDNLSRDGVETRDFTIDWKTFLSEYYDVPIKAVITEEEIKNLDEGREEEFPEDKEWYEIIDRGLDYGESCL